MSIFEVMKLKKGRSFFNLKENNTFIVFFSDYLDEHHSLIIKIRSKRNTYKYFWRVCLLQINHKQLLNANVVEPLDTTIK